MLYHLVRPVARFVLSFYYRNIDITGLEHIPRDAPVILAANHPTAFLEPCLMACFQHRTLHFLARGDLFRYDWAKLILRALNILPVYRIQDGGYDKLVRNYDTFEECYSALGHRRALMILAEGRCIHEKKLRPLRKGTARIALGALNRDNTLGEVYIVPVGVNFSAADRVRSTVMIRCGPPIATSQFLDSYRRHGGRGIRELTQALRAALSPLVVQWPEAAPPEVCEPLLTARRNAAAVEASGITHSGRGLQAQLDATSRLDFSGPGSGSLRYAALLKIYGIRDRDLALASARHPVTLPWTVLPAALMLLPQLPGWVMAEAIALAGPKTIEFYSSVRFAAVGVLTLLYLPGLFLLPWPAAIWLLASLLTVRWSLRQLEACRDWWGRKKLGQLAAAERDRMEALRASLL